jgi:PAS domain S-box-containing protein
MAKGTLHIETGAVAAAGRTVEGPKSEQERRMKSVRILHMEDDKKDAELVQAMLIEDGLDCRVNRVETRTSFAAALDEGEYDLIISDFTLPSYDGQSALALAQAKCPDIPFIFFSGTIGEELAIQVLQNGATDYVLKQRPARFVSAVRRALSEAEKKSARMRVDQALRNAQERFRGIYESSTDAIAYASLDGHLLDVNQSFAKLTGYTREELLTKTYQELTPKEFRVMEDKLVQAILKKGEPAEYEKEFIRKDGSRVPICLTVFAVNGQSGTAIGLAAIIKDITERKGAEEALRKTEERLRQIQKMEAIGQLTGGIAHDFNNLLLVINGYSDLTLDKLTVDDPLRQNVDQIRQAGERAASLTRQLLAFSRRQVLAPKVLDLNVVVRGIETMLRRMIGEDILFETALQSGLCRVEADPGQIEQVIMNLAVNARGAMPEGGKLIIETTNVELDEFRRPDLDISPGPYVLLAVSDTGIGMDKETQERIFEPFFTTKETGKGTGLGLATVYGIVKQSGGYIWVYSEPGQGTTFKIYLPSVEKAVETASPGPMAVTSIGGWETILLTEDEAAVRKLVQCILTTHGYTVIEAGNGVEALSVFAQHTAAIHLVITDVVMPVMGGRELASRLVSARPDTRILYLSGYADNAVVRHGVLEPGCAFLQKPFSKDALLRKVREVLDGPPKEAI